MNGRKKSAEIGEANGMVSLPTGPTEIRKTGNVGFLDAPIAALYSHLALEGRVMQ